MNSEGYSGPLDTMGLFTPQNPTNPAEYYWIVEGIMSPNSSFLFIGAQTIIPTETYFAQLGTDFIIVQNPFDSPDKWIYNTSRVPSSDSLLTWNSGIAYNSQDGFIYMIGLNSYAPQDPAVLARISDSSLSNFDWSAMSFWTSIGWFSSPKYLVPLYSGPYTESTLQYHVDLEIWFTVLLAPFDYNINADYNIYIAYSKELTGTWAKDVIYSVPPPYNDDSQFWCYAAKSHPEYVNQTNEIIVTYNINTPTLTSLATNLNVYHPNFVQINLAPGSPVNCGITTACNSFIIVLLIALNL